MTAAAPTLRQRYGYLPAAAVLVLEAAGEDAMFRLVAAAGGTDVQTALPNALIDLLGPEAGRAVHARCVAAGHEKLYIPRMTRTLELRRRERLLTLRSSGMTIREIALTVGLTERAVYMALAKAREGGEDRQMILPGLA